MKTKTIKEFVKKHFYLITGFYRAATYFLSFFFGLLMVVILVPKNIVIEIPGWLLWMGVAMSIGTTWLTWKFEDKWEEDLESIRKVNPF
jgi:hypothetical protein